MTKKTTILLLLSFILVVAYSYLGIPKKYYTEGGSCYQGITTMFIQFFLTICTVLNSIAIALIYFTTKIKKAKVVSIISLILWSIGTFIHSHDDIATGLKYFTPLLLLNLIMVILLYKSEKNNA